MVIRSFLAFELPPEIRKIVTRVSEVVSRSTLNVKWVNVDNIHLTVVFMGNIKAEDLSDMGEAIGNVCSRHRPFDLSLKGMRAFPNIRRPRVLWLGLDGEIERMSSFRDDLQTGLCPFGIKEEKRTFKPHLTIGRFRKAGRADSQLDEIMRGYRDISSSVCQIDELIMFKSELKRSGAEYTKLESWPLSE